LQAHQAAGNTQAIADALSAGRTKIATRFTSARGVLEKYPAGPVAADALLSKLEAFAATTHPLASLVKRANGFLAQADGLDLGSPATLGMLDALAGGGVITTAERDGLKTIATVPDPVTHTEVGAALMGA
jgi:hypothetical protein